MKVDYATLANFLGAWFPDADLDRLRDEDVARQFAATVSRAELQTTIKEGRGFLTERELPIAVLSRESNRRFEEPEAARNWLRSMIDILEAEAARRIE